MNRLDFQLPEFVRVAWVSELAKEYWEPKIRNINACWPIVERGSVMHDMRSGALQSIPPEQLPEIQDWSLRTGIGMAILDLEGTHGSYGNASIPYIPGRPFTYRVYLGQHPREFKDAWRSGNNHSIGSLIGFPECCTDFFDRRWREEGWRDLTIPAMIGPEIRNLIYNNVLLKHLGVRPIFHLPCSFDCRNSCRSGMAIQDLMEVLGYTNEAQSIRELVSMPMEWTSLHGVAILVTPIFKMVYNTDPIAEKVTLKLLSEHYPEHGARGNQFPLIDPKPLQFHIPTFNGFKTMAAMIHAHQFILSALPESLDGKILDLGCGTGELLRRLRDEYQVVTSYGVDRDESLIVRAVKNSQAGDSFIVSDIFDYEWDTIYELVLIAIQRFSEVERGRVIKLLNNIAADSEYLLLYSYGIEWFHGVDDLISQRFQVVSASRDSVSGYEAVLLERKTP